MKYISALVFLLIGLVYSASSQNALESLLPDPYDLPGMKLDGNYDFYKGDNLFDLINGGAEVYLEYGFIEVLIQDYTSADHRSNLRIEIYEFDSPESAFGIMTYSNMGSPIKESRSTFRVSGVGYEYLQKGSYFIIVTYSNIKNDLNTSIVKRVITGLSENIDELAQPPNIYYSSNSPCPSPKMTLFFRGKLALRNMTYIGFDLPFKYKEGMAFKCDTLDYIVFLPISKKTQQELVQETISNILNKYPNFTPEKTAFGFAIKDGEKLKFELRPEAKRFVLIKYE